MNNDALTTLIVGGRTAKEYSQRELARRIGISNSSLNDIENGRVAKPDPEILKRIAEELELSLQQLLKAAGYNEVMSWFSHDEFKNKSTKDLKNTIEECRLFKYDILDWDANKRKQAQKVGTALFNINNKIVMHYDEYGKEARKFLEEVVEDLNKANLLLNSIHEKYDYSKLPKDNNSK